MVKRPPLRISVPSSPAPSTTADGSAPGKVGPSGPVLISGTGRGLSLIHHIRYSALNQTWNGFWQPQSVRPPQPPGAAVLTVGAAEASPGGVGMTTTAAGFALGAGATAGGATAGGAASAKASPAPVSSV